MSWFDCSFVPNYNPTTTATIGLFLSYASVQNEHLTSNTCPFPFPNLLMIVASDLN
jgi:hypothetical protein